MTWLLRWPCATNVTSVLSPGTLPRPRRSLAKQSWAPKGIPAIPRRAGPAGPPQRAQAPPAAPRRFPPLRADPRRPATGGIWYKDDEGGEAVSIRRILEALSSNDYRVTWQRWAVAAHIALKGDQLFTVEELYQSLKAHYPDIGLTTVYRTLDLLVDLGVITRVHGDDGVARYGMRVPGVTCAVQLRCEVCGDTRPLEIEQLQPLLQAAAAEAEMLLTSCEVRLDGICSRCRRERVSLGGAAPGTR
nr:hypothetical protein [Bacillota bacterium]